MKPRIPNGFQVYEIPELDDEFGGDSLPPEGGIYVGAYCDTPIQRSGRWTPKKLMKRRLRIMAKYTTDKMGRIARYARIILAYARGQEEIEFARMAHECLGKALEIPPAKNK